MLLAVSSPAGGSIHSRTANWIAAARAKETEGPGALFLDPYAAMLEGHVGRAALAASERASGGPNEFLPLRTRFFDDVILAEVLAGYAGGPAGRWARHPGRLASRCRTGSTGLRSTTRPSSRARWRRSGRSAPPTRCRMPRLVGADFELEMADVMRLASHAGRPADALGRRGRALLPLGGARRHPRRAPPPLALGDRERVRGRRERDNSHAGPAGHAALNPQVARPPGPAAALRHRRASRARRRAGWDRAQDS